MRWLHEQLKAIVAWRQTWPKCVTPANMQLFTYACHGTGQQITAVFIRFYLTLFYLTLFFLPLFFLPLFSLTDGVASPRLRGRESNAKHPLDCPAIRGEAVISGLFLAVC